MTSGRWRWLAVNFALFIAVSALSAFAAALFEFIVQGGFEGWEGADPATQVIGYAMLSLPYLWILGLLPLGMLLLALVVDAQLIQVPRLALAFVGLVGGYLFAVLLGAGSSIGPTLVAYAPGFVLLGLVLRRR